MRGKRLSTAYVFPILMVIFVIPMMLTLLNAYQNKERLTLELESSTEQLMNMAVASATDALWTYNDDSLVQICDAIADYKRVAIINIMDENNNVIYGVNKTGKEYDDKQLYPAFTRYVMYEGIKIGNIHIVVTAYYLHEMVREKIMFGFYETIIISFIIWFIVYIFTRNVTAAIDNIDSGVKAFAEGDRNVRIYVNDSHEIRRLADRINIMFQRIVASDIMLHENYLKLQTKEEDLKASEERYRYAVEGSNDAIWDWNLETNDYYVSARGAQMIGEADNKEIDLETWISHIHEKDRFSFEYYLHNFECDPDSYQEIQFRVINIKGDIKWLICRGKGILNKKNKLLRVSGFYTDITERIRAEEAIQQLAYFDTLTGLPNRVMLYEQGDKIFAEVKFHLKNGAIIFMDLDDFKTINDTKGHTFGDQVLKNLANELKEKIKYNAIARIGGDEFIFILEDCDYEQVKIIAKEIVNLVHAPRIIKDYEYLLSCSVGIAMFHEDGVDIETLLMKADSAMYQAKVEGKNRYKFYDQSINDEMVKKIKLRNEIRQGIINKEFVVYYQPQVNIVSGKISGVEALVRWRHPIRGLVMPGDFIDLAEETGLIIPLGEYVLRTACRQSMEWERAGLTGIMMSVNISVKQINSLNIVQDILDIIDETHMIPEHLILEITESVAMENISKTIDIMNQLREKGITFSLDDFGTGYSSLNYLKNIPINHLKIDKQFVQNLQRQTFEEVVVRSIIEIAHRMELTVVAEGIETLEQKEALTSYNCDIAQGYYYSKPIPHQEVESFIKGI
ncbi:bifunctional diguanylate cyclase/phosphodiesterase [Anaerocolumna chitinilytica]|uniref:EAL domain-containing protein n=1 Tax=Anaerocolumna chitinilytica TaxID=1727145 RepID=A0A7I8DL25_9FIRM|nr:bifunctional diguanylate cyclase/phosphodiesterase [Anaerocolumna chitinilytica]BCJ99060.1 hypothetical protein bsdcttw_21010 [Anaerocolumna chitinilytica]